MHEFCPPSNPPFLSPASSRPPHLYLDYQPCAFTSAQPALNAFPGWAHPQAPPRTCGRDQPVSSCGRVHSHVGRVLQAGVGVRGWSTPVQPHGQSHPVHHA